MQYSCGKININIPDGYGDIKDIVFSAHIIVRYNNGPQIIHTSLN